MNKESVKSFSRFAIEASGAENYYLACDLDEAKIWFWENIGDKNCVPLFFSGDIEERVSYQSFRESLMAHESSQGIELQNGDVEHLKEIVAQADIKKTRTITDEYMYSKTEGWRYRDNWSIDFYAEFDDGLPPIIIRGIHFCSFNEDEELFEQLETYLFSNLGLRDDHFCSFAYNPKMTVEQQEKLVFKALDVGISAIYQLLWDGTASQIALLDELPHKTPFRYDTSSKSFTLRYENDVILAWKPWEAPNCVHSFGLSHDFQQ